MLRAEESSWEQGCAELVEGIAKRKRFEDLLAFFSRRSACGSLCPFANLMVQSGESACSGSARPVAIGVNGTRLVFQERNGMRRMNFHATSMGCIDCRHDAWIFISGGIYVPVMVSRGLVMLY